MDRKVHHYSFEGLEFDVPLKKRRYNLGYIEDYSELIDHPKVTPLGHPVIFTLNEPCEFGKSLPPRGKVAGDSLTDEGQIAECVDCPYFQRADVEHHTLIGICTHDSMKQGGITK